MMWRISRESVMLIGGRATVLLQLAHPLIAAGVAHHSDYRSDPYSRLRRTLDTMYTIVFESEDDAREAAAKVTFIHSHVQGVADDGRSYSALDPHLQLWVHATLIEGSLKVYERFVAPLSPAELARYYEETKVVGELFGIPRSSIPQSYEDLKEWMRELIDIGEVQVTDLARALAEPIVRPLRIVPRSISSRSALITPSLLPPPIRNGYGLRLSTPKAALVAVGTRASRLVTPRLPGGLRVHPVGYGSDVSHLYLPRVRPSDAARSYFGGILRAPSKRIVSPFSIGFSTI
jgi:uncharacterized protein (DUF2236 family)